MSSLIVISLCIVCFVLCTTIVRIVSDGKMNMQQVVDQVEETHSFSDSLYFVMLFLCYAIFAIFVIFVIATNLQSTLVFLSFVLLWKSLDIKEYCLNSIVSYIKEKMKEE